MVSPGAWSAQGAGVDHDVQIAVAVEIAERRLDLTVQRLVDAWLSIPSLLILLTVMSVVGRGVLQIILVLGVLGVLGGIGGSRVVRGAVIGAKEQVYFEAARAVGSSRWRTLVHHLLPNIAPVLIVIYSINIGAVVISEASLSFLGFGLPTTVPSWGGMLSREGRKYMEIAPRLAVWPGLCLTVVVYCLNMVGDAGARPARPAPARRQRPARRLRRAGCQQSHAACTACAVTFYQRVDRVSPINQAPDSFLGPLQGVVQQGRRGDGAVTYASTSARRSGRVQLDLDRRQLVHTRHS